MRHLFRRRRSNGYIPAAETVRDAKHAGISVEAYVERMWNAPRATAALVERIRGTGALEPTASGAQGAR